MNIAVNASRGCCLSVELGGGSYLFGVASGFGQIDGENAAAFALRGLRHEFERRARSSRFGRMLQRPRSIIALLSGAFGRINDELHSRSGSHEDYVTASVSMTAALLVGERAYLAHAGATSAYLGRRGSLIALTKNDAFEDDRGLPVLMRALGPSQTLELSVSAFALSDGDALVLAQHGVAEAAERVVVSYASQDEPAQVTAPPPAHIAQSILTGVLATLLFYALLAIG